MAAGSGVGMVPLHPLTLSGAEWELESARPEVVMPRVIVAAALACALALSGCGSDGGKKNATDAGSTSSSTVTSTTSTTVPCHFSGTVDPQQNALASVDQLLTDVTTSTDGCVDTITFTFRPNAAPAPSYQIEFAEPPFRDSAGREVKPAGTVYLKIRFQPAWIADLSMESAPATYTGPKVITPVGMSAVRGLALYEATEAVVGWVIGLDEPFGPKPPFSVEATPGKVVVKVVKIP